MPCVSLKIGNLKKKILLLLLLVLYKHCMSNIGIAFLLLARHAHWQRSASDSSLRTTRTRVPDPSAAARVYPSNRAPESSIAQFQEKIRNFYFSISIHIYLNMYNINLLWRIFLPEYSSTSRQYPDRFKGQYLSTRLEIPEYSSYSCRPLRIS